MDLSEAQSGLKQLLNKVKPTEVQKLLHWIRNTDEFDHLLTNNNTVILQSICDWLRERLPQTAMLSNESMALSKMQHCANPTVHVDSFLYSEDLIDSLCDQGSMSRNFCLSCGSTKTAALDFISHSFSISELGFLFEHLLPDLSDRTVVDVGSRLGAVLYGAYVFSSSSQIVGLEINEDFVKLQNEILQKYKMADRIKVLLADVCVCEQLIQNTDLLIMNNVFEFFMEPDAQVRAWSFIMENFRKRGSLLVTVPSLQESLQTLKVALPAGWLEELPVDSDVYLGRDSDQDALREIHLYRVL